MTIYNPHPHAEVLRAIADGVPLSDIECRAFDWEMDCWRVLSSTITAELISRPDVWYARRKPQYITVNGFKVPRPLSVPEMGMDYFCPSIETPQMYESYTWAGDTVDKRVLQRGVVHSTAEAATAHAKAMLGIDPEYFK